MSQKVLSQIDADGNATVVLNRPDVHNAFDPEMVDALTATLKKLEADAKVRAVVLTGAGKSFCAGADIEHMKKSAKFSREQNLENARATAHDAADALHAEEADDRVRARRGARRRRGPRRRVRHRDRRARARPSGSPR